MYGWFWVIGIGVREGHIRLLKRYIFLPPDISYCFGGFLSVFLVYHIARYLSNLIFLYQSIGEIYMRAAGNTAVAGFPTKENLRLLTGG